MILFSQRIRKLREAAGYRSQQSFADAFGVAQSTVGGWEAGKREPNFQTLNRLAAFFNTTSDYLLGNDANQSSATIRIPVLGSIPAGIPVEAVEEILDWEEIPSEWTRGGKEYFALKVKGDSMYPKYLNGDTVILRKQNICDSGDDCAVMVNGFEGTLKQVILHEDGSLEIRPCNTAYNPRTFTPDEIRALPVSIAGVVVELRRKIK